MTQNVVNAGRVQRNNLNRRDGVPLLLTPSHRCPNYALFAAIQPKRRLNAVHQPGIWLILLAEGGQVRACDAAGAAALLVEYCIHT